MNIKMTFDTPPYYFFLGRAVEPRSKIRLYSCGGVVHSFNRFTASLLFNIISISFVDYITERFMTLIIRPFYIEGGEGEEGFHLTSL